MSLHSVSLVLHVAAGSLALLLFWTAALQRKGTPRHRRIGQIYLLSMLGVIASGLPLAYALLERGRPAGALFLTYLLLLVGNSCWNAWRAIRERPNRRGYFGPLYWGYAGVLALYGAGLMAIGLRDGFALFAVFGSIGLLSLAGSLLAWRRAPSDPKWWLKQHYGAMIGNGVATHIAFIGVGLRGALPGVDPQLLQSLAWFGPLAAALLAGGWLNRKYGRSTAPRRSSVASTELPASG